MPAPWIGSQLKDKPTISNIRVVNNRLLSFDRNLGGATEHLIVYIPSPQDYVVTADVAKKAIDSQANLLVAEPWCGITGAAQSFGRRYGLKLFALGVFLGKVDRNEEF